MLSWLPRLELDRKRLFRRKPGGQSSDFYKGIGSSRHNKYWVFMEITRINHISEIYYSVLEVTW